MPNKRGALMRHMLMLSMALNSVLILRLIYTSEINWQAEKGLHGFCMAENQQIGKAVVVSSLSPATSKNIPRIEDENGGGKVINLDHGDPTMYAKFWHQMGNKTTLVIPGWQSISYFSDVKNLCWFMEPDLTKAIIRLHKLVGNAITKDRHIVVGTGSSQLFQAALYALCPPESPEPTSVISAAPYYSSYPLMTDFLKSGLYKWAGDAHKFSKSKNQPYIELVTSPNNPDGSTRQAVVNRSGGILIHDLAYYWPQYTPITFPADYDLMLFTVSKSTGHAGTRIGWAVVKSEEVARKMTKFIEVNTIGVSKDSQLRAAKILNSVANTYDDYSGNPYKENGFFEKSYGVMYKRWNQLKEAVRKNPMFSLPVFPWSYCNFNGRKFESQPAFAWLKCEGAIEEDCEKVLGDHKILTRGGKHFGYSSKYVRISMLEEDENFDIFIHRLSRIHS